MMPTVADTLVASWTDIARVTAVFVALGVAGAVFVRRALGCRDLISIVSLGGILGVVAWLATINWVGRLIEYPIASMVSLGFVIAAGGALEVFARRREASLHDPFVTSLGASRRATLGILGLAAWASASSTIATARVLHFDDTMPSHIPSALQIAAGYFPASEPGDPKVPFGYHYAPEMLAASLQEVAGLPVWYGYDAQLALFSFLMVPLAYVLLRTLLAQTGPALRARGAFVGMIVLIWGSTLTWLMAFADEGFREAVRELAHDPAHGAAWVSQRILSIADIGIGEIIVSIFPAMHTHSNGMAFPIALAAVWLGWCLFAAPTRDRSPAMVGTFIIAGSFLALAAETVWALVMAGLLVLLVTAAIRARSWRHAAAGIAAFVAVGLIVRVQGGVLTAGPGSAPAAEPSFIWNDDLSIPSFVGTVDIPSLQFILEWVPMFSIAVVTGAVLLRRGKWEQVALALGVGVLGFFIPVLLFYTRSPPEIIRFFQPSLAALAGLAGVGLAALTLHRLGRWIAWPVIGTLVLSSFVFQVQYIVFPLTSLSRVPAKGETPEHPEFLAPAASNPYNFNEADVEDVRWLRALPKEAIVLSPYVDNYFHQAFNASGRPLHYGYLPERNETIMWAMNRLDVRRLRELDVTHVYLSWKHVAGTTMRVERLEDEDDFRLVYESGSGDDRRAAWEFLGAERD